MRIRLGVDQSYYIGGEFVDSNESIGNEKNETIQMIVVVVVGGGVVTNNNPASALNGKFLWDDYTIQIVQP